MNHKKIHNLMQQIDDEWIEKALYVEEKRISPKKVVAAAAIFIGCILISTGVAAAISPDFRQWILEQTKILEEQCNPGEVKWNTEKTVSWHAGVYTFHGFLSEDEMKCWIYFIEIEEGSRENKLVIPRDIDGALVIYLGSPGTNPNEEHDYEFEKNIFGETVETYHDVSGYIKDLKTINKLVVPDTVVEIGAFAFAGMEYLKEAELSSNLKSIDDWAFYGCKNLKKVQLSENVEYIASNAFEECPHVKEMSIGEKSDYTNKNGFIINEKTNTLTDVLPSQKDGIIPEGVEIIQTGAFSDATMRKVTIPKTVRMIEKDALTNKNIAKVNIVADHPYLEKEERCIYYKSDRSLAVAEIDFWGRIVISNQVEMLKEEYSIVGKNAKTLIISGNLKKSYGMALSHLAVEGVKNVYFQGKNPPVIENCELGNAAFPVFVNVYVPRGSKEEYEKCYKENDDLDGLFHGIYEY